MDVHILTPTASPTVAVGVDALGIAEALRSNGHATRVYAGDWDSSCAGEVLPLAAYTAEAMSSPRAVLIYQHAIGWPRGERLLRKTNNIAVIRYHNVTPSKFFSGHSKEYVSACAMGETQTRRFARARNFWYWPDSMYNQDQLIECGAPISRCSVLPPFHSIERMAAGPVDMSLARQIEGAETKLLFVSGIKPHKGHLRALGILSAYCRLHDPSARLVFAGTTDERLSGYIQELHETTARLGLERNVIFATDISWSQLLGLYSVADVLLCVSEHEGFGVPLVEAMYFGVPVVAWARAAVPETLGGVGVILPEYDDIAFAEAIRSLIVDRKLAHAITRAGRERYREHFQIRVIERRLFESLDQVSRDLCENSPIAI